VKWVLIGTGILLGLVVLAAVDVLIEERQLKKAGAPASTDAPRSLP
jgi:hypothetical protein